MGEVFVVWEVRYLKKCGYRTCLVGDEIMVSPSSVAYGATFPLKGEGYCADFFRFYFEMLIFDKCLKF